jgi:protein-disulfide isomerase
MKISLIIATFMSVSFLALAATPPASVCPTSETAVVEINGTKLTLSDLEHDNPSLAFQARNVCYEAEHKAIDAFVDQYLLEQQAKAENVTVDQLLEKHVKSTIAKDPSDESLRVYYEGVDTTLPFEAVRQQIIDSIRQRRIAKAKAEYLQTLRSKGEIATLLPAPRAEIAMKDVVYRGPQTAPVVLVEYADYECPYCQQAEPILEKLAETYKGKIAFVFKDMPLPMHSHAQKAAEASRCAEAQGKYWQYHDLLFAQKQLDAAGLSAAAKQLNLDEQAFNKCLESGATASGIKASANEGQALGIPGTPAIFINGKVYNSALTFEKLQAAIEEELHKASATASQIAAR